MKTIKKHFKKLILVLVLLMLFNFCYPNISNATGGLFDIPGEISKLFFWMERGLFGLVNNLFSDEDHQYEYINTTTFRLWFIEIDTPGEIRFTVHLTPETIIKGKYLLFNANIFEDTENVEQTDPEKYYDDGEGKDTVIGRNNLRKVISGWYYSLRNFTIVALLSVLVYVGIRMTISTLAQDKAKYKTMFKDWLVAICLVVVMHYIMIGTLNLTSLIVDAIGNNGSESSQITKIMMLIELIHKEPDANGDTRFIDREGIFGATNKEYTIGDAFAYEFLLAAIFIYTIIFAVKYLKREFTIIFLILLGPISCITYPIDKIGDGKAQAFNKWLIEFIYNVIIQPFHLLIYTVLVGTAVQLASGNVLYSLVCFAVMIPAEKFIKEMFGFRDRLGSPMGDMMKAGLARDAISRATSRILGGKNGTSGGSNNSSENNNSLPQSPTTRDIDNRLLGGANGQEEVTADSADQGNGQFISDDDVGQITGDAAAYDAIDSEDSGASYIEDNGLDTADEQSENSRLLEEQAEAGYRDASRDNEQSEDSQRPPNQRNLQKKGLINWFDNTKAGKIHAQRMLKKYGTTSRKRRWAKRAGKGVKSLAKGSLIGGLATLGAGMAFATGNGKEAFGIIAGTAALGAKKGYKTIKGVVNKNAVKDYYKNDAMPGISYLANQLGFNKERRELAEFERDQKQQDGAILNFRKNHGRDPSNSELQKEMEDRFALSQFGLTDTQIDSAIGEYQKLREENLKDAQRIEDEAERQNAIETAEESAAQQAAFQAMLAERYKNKFGKEKDMQDAINAVTKRFTDAGVAEGISRQNAVKYLQNAAKMNKETMLIPGDNKTVDVKLPNVSKQLGIEKSSDFGNIEIERMNSLTFRLHDMGLTNTEIKAIASSSADSKVNTLGVLNNYEARVEFISEQRAEARQYIAESKRINPEDVSKEDIKVEVTERLTSFNLGAKKEDMDYIRKAEETVYMEENKQKNKSEKERAIEIASKITDREMQNESKMNKLIEKTALDDYNGDKNKAAKLYERAANLKGTELKTKYKYKPEK